MCKLLLQFTKKENIVFTGTVGQYLQSHWPNLQLRLFSWGKTKRTLSNGPKNCELTLDQTSYPDGATDYELEIENPQPHLIKGVQTQLEKEFSFHQTKSNSNQNKITRARRHRKDP